MNHFVCQDCHKTWPDKDNQMPEDDREGRLDGTCPECADDDDDDDGESGPWSNSGGGGGRAPRGGRRRPSVPS